MWLEPRGRCWSAPCSSRASYARSGHTFIGSSAASMLPAASLEEPPGLSLPWDRLPRCPTARPPQAAGPARPARPRPCSSVPSPRPAQRHGPHAQHRSSIARAGTAAGHGGGNGHLALCQDERDQGPAAGASACCTQRCSHAKHGRVSLENEDHLPPPCVARTSISSNRPSSHDH